MLLAEGSHEQERRAGTPFRAIAMEGYSRLYAQLHRTTSIICLEQLVLYSFICATAARSYISYEWPGSYPRKE